MVADGRRRRQDAIAGDGVDSDSECGRIDWIWIPALFWQSFRRMADSATTFKGHAVTYFYILLYIALSSGQIFFNKVQFSSHCFHTYASCVWLCLCEAVALLCGACFVSASWIGTCFWMTRCAFFLENQNPTAIFFACKGLTQLVQTVALSHISKND